MPESVKSACRRADITTKSTLMEIVRQPDESSMLALIEAIERHGLTRDEVRLRKRNPHGSEAGASDREAGSPARPFVFRYNPKGRGFSMSLRFDGRDEVEPTELLKTLEGIVAELKDQIRSEQG
jgi:ParB family chromosome partitioning protein